MFFAHKSDSNALLQAVFGGEFSVFWSVVLQGRFGHFMVEYSKIEEGQSALAIKLVSRVSEIKAMQEDPEIEIDSIYLVSPQHVNKSSGWRLDLLKEVWRLSASDRDSGVDGLQYVLANGESYFLGASDHPDNTKVRLI